MADLPQVLNPTSGYVQNCNSTPFTTTSNAGPAIGDYPHYMVEDRYDESTARRRRGCCSKTRTT